MAKFIRSFPAPFGPYLRILQCFQQLVWFGSGGPLYKNSPFRIQLLFFLLTPNLVRTDPFLLRLIVLLCFNVLLLSLSFLNTQDSTNQAIFQRYTQVCSFCTAWSSYIPVYWLLLCEIGLLFTKGSKSVCMSAVSAFANFSLNTVSIL